MKRATSEHDRSDRGCAPMSFTAHHMSIPVFVPIISQLLFVRSGDDFRISNFLCAVWERMEPYLKGMEVDLSLVSLRSLVGDLQKISFATQS